MVLYLKYTSRTDRKETGLTGRHAAGESPVFDPPDLQQLLPPYFVVLSGPCTLAEGGRCVGRWPGSYLANEACQISVAGAGGSLGACPVFDLASGDCVRLPDGSCRTGAQSGPYADGSCPAGALLASGQTLSWLSTSTGQGVYSGNNGGQAGDGLPHNGGTGAGGGWQICFA